jgi:hypothetical protein
VENFFQRIKRLRRIAMRYEKLARNYMAFLHLASPLNREWNKEQGTEKGNDERFVRPPGARAGR